MTLKLLGKRCLLGVLLFLYLTPEIGFSREYQTNRVVLVIIDGLRYSEGLGDISHEFTPRMTELASQGALVGDFQNDGYTYTSQAVPAIWCGVWTSMNNFSDSTCAGASNSYSSLPSLFEYYRKGLSRPQTDCVYALKDLCSWKGSFHAEYGPDYWPLYHTQGVSDEDVWHETEQIISDLAPHLLLMYLADVDHEGHSGNWDNYTRAITIADSLVGVLWETLQADPEYAGLTTLLVTNDHGRHTTNFTGHGDDCDGCRQIQLLVVGPDVHPGLLSNIPRVIPDITPTIGDLLGFETPYASGTPMLELFQETTGIRPSLPESSTLIELYPNPANPETRIRITLKEANSVALSIYDIQGRSVANLHEGYLSSGVHELAWDGSNDQGQVIPSGAYLLVLRSASRTEIHKLLLLK